VKALKLKIITIFIAFLVLSAVVVVIIQEQNQIPPEPTTPYYIYLIADYPKNFYMDVDGAKYYNESATFYWSVGTTHTISVLNEIKNQIKNPNLPPAIQPESWRLVSLGNSKSNTIQITVKNGTSAWLNDPNKLEIEYEAIYNHTG
jgi:hypothetical protein